MNKICVVLVAMSGTLAGVIALGAIATLFGLEPHSFGTVGDYVVLIGAAFIGACAGVSWVLR